MDAPRAEPIWLVPRRVSSAGLTAAGAVVLTGLACVTGVGAALLWALTNVAIIGGLSVGAFAAAALALGWAIVLRTREKRRGPTSARDDVRVRVSSEEIWVRRPGEADVVLPRTAAGGLEVAAGVLTVGEQTADVTGIDRVALMSAAERQGWFDARDAEPRELTTGPDPDDGWANPPRVERPPLRSPRRFATYRAASDDPTRVTFTDGRRFAPLSMPPSAMVFVGLSATLALAAVILGGVEAGNVVAWTGLLLWLPWLVSGWAAVREGWPYGRSRVPERRVEAELGPGAIDLRRGDGRARRFVAGSPLVWDAETASLTQRGKQPLGLPGFDIETFAAEARALGWEVEGIGETREIERGR